MIKRFVSLTGEGGATTNTRAAAALYALDVPLNESRTFTSIAGHGIDGVRVTWHFQEFSPRWGAAAAMLKAWDDQQHAADHPDCPLVNIKAAFLRYSEIVRQIKDGTMQCKAPPAERCSTRSSKQAAAMERLGHPIVGVTFSDGGYWFHFPQAAASDFSLWELPSGELEKRLPDSLISYLWCAFYNHEVMVDFIKQSGAQFAAVAHRGRVAYIGKDSDQNQINQLERLLYRR